MVIMMTKLPAYSNIASTYSNSNGKLNYTNGFLKFLVGLLIVICLFKVFTEYMYQEKLQTLKIRKSFVIKKHEIHEDLNPNILYFDSTNSSAYKVEEEIFDVEVIDLPTKNSLLNISDFKWLRNNESLCHLSSDLNIFAVLVHTSRAHFIERQAARSTWASLKNYNGWSVRPVFLMGVASSKTNASDLLLEEQKLDEEHKRYGDIITGNFIDSYRNLTYKHVMGHKWILEFCANASFVMKTDDDMFIDIIHFIDMRINATTEYQNFQEEDEAIYCYEFIGAKPLRSKNDKWYVTIEEWPEETFPLYCSGWAYGITVDWIQKIYLMSYQTKYFWIDDVFIGILLNMATSFYDSSPQVKSINSLYTFDNRQYLGMCNSTSSENNLANTTRNFGAVVYVERSGEFARQMECLWNKVLFEKDLFLG